MTKKKVKFVEGTKTESRPSQLSRKDKRKQDRLQKKLKKQEHLTNRNKLNRQKLTDNGPGKFVRIPKQSTVEKTKVQDAPGAVKKEESSSVSRMNDVINREKRRKYTLEKEMKKMRIRQLKEENKKEDVLIKKLEKKLKLNKRKSKNIPKSFSEAGLDYILDICDPEKIKTAVTAERNLQDSESEFEEDFAIVSGKRSDFTKGKKVRFAKKKEEEDAEEEEEMYDLSEDNMDDDDVLEEDGSDSFDGESDDEAPLEMSSSKRGIKRKQDDEHSNVPTKKNMKLDIEEDEEEDETEDELSDGADDEGSVVEEKEETWEDIYGRLRDKEGNILQAKETKYVPPHLREQNEANPKKKEELEKLRKQLKGLLNRLAENNMHNISNQIDEFYMKHSRHDMNNTLLNLYLTSLITPILTPERLVLEHAMLIAILHANVGSEVGAFFIQHLVKKFDEILSKNRDIENKEPDNLLLLLCHMYTFKIFDSTLLYDILKKLCDRFAPKDIDLILIVLRTVGFGLRKDNPISLKEFILNVQKLASDASGHQDDSRVRFMLDVLLSIKNNNMTKIPQYDPSHAEHLKKILKSMLRQGNYVTELRLTLEDVLKADERGKWWLVGSAWTGPSKDATKTSQSAIKGVNQFGAEILELARQQRMNTANRRNVFCILMTAEDYLDAFEKLLRLGLKGQPEQEIIHVIIHCLLNEKLYNPYYSHLTDQLCLSDRRHKMTLQCAIWDRFKEMNSLSKCQITVFAKYLSHLFLRNSLPISALKALEFAEMDKPSVRLLRQLLLTLLLHDDQEAVVQVFSKVAKPSKLHMFRESIRLFIHHFLLKNIKDSDEDDESLLKQRITLVDNALTTFSNSSAQF